MPCMDTCHFCHEYNCVCRPKKGKPEKFNVEGALCDVLTILEDKHITAFYDLDPKIHDWWREHEAKEEERVKKEALAKLTLRERKALGLK